MLVRLAGQVLLSGSCALFADTPNSPSMRSFRHGDRRNAQAAAQRSLPVGETTGHLLCHLADGVHHLADRPNDRQIAVLDTMRSF
jgi:hypothetical protein